MKPIVILSELWRGLFRQTEARSDRDRKFNATSARLRTSNPYKQSRQKIENGTNGSSRPCWACIRRQSSADCAFFLPGGLR